MAQGRDFAEADKATVLAEHARLVAEVIPLHQRLQDAGQIEITTTPFFHPILPLLFNTDLAKVATPDIELPARFSYPLDAIEQVNRGVQFYTETFGQPPKGMWPAEGAVAQEIVNMVGDAGIQWMATDEEVLARSLGQTGFARNAQDTVQDADTLYRPYIASTANNQVYTVFRDKVISDKVGFTYSGTPGTEAAQDFVNRILAIREQLASSGAEGPHLVSVILDGENAWENYPNDGKEFLNELYRLLEEEQAKGTIQTITPSAYIAQFPEQPALEDAVGRQLGQPRLPDLDRRAGGEPRLGRAGPGARLRQGAGRPRGRRYLRPDDGRHVHGRGQRLVLVVRRGPEQRRRWQLRRPVPRHPGPGLRAGRPACAYLPQGADHPGDGPAAGRGRHGADLAHHRRRGRRRRMGRRRLLH